MNNIKNIEKMNNEEIAQLLKHLKENEMLELKEASDLPKSIWSTYSAFCNTSGGYIVLGVKESEPQNEIKGLKEAEKLVKNLWDQLRNPSKVSLCTVENEDVSIYRIDGKEIVIIHVNEAKDNQKPVYLNDQVGNTYIRVGEGDSKVTKEELATLMRNAQPDYDSQVAEKFDLNDLDLDALIVFKEKVNRRFPKKKYIEMEPWEFLVEIGAANRDRETGVYTLKKGTLLFLGKVNSIKEIFPRYHLDFFDMSGNNPRWSDRVSDDEPSAYEMNLFNFYNIVSEKIKVLLRESFELDENQERVADLSFDEIVREALVNCLAHADYIMGYPSTRIEVHDGWFSFANPGKMLISREQFFIGGDSRPRNEIVMKLFRLLGLSERQGFGGSLVYKTALENDLRKPELITDFNHTELKVWNIDLAESHPELDEESKNVLRFFVKNPKLVSLSEIQDNFKITEYRARIIINQLMDKQLVIKTGKGPATRYGLNIDTKEALASIQIIMDYFKKRLM